MTVLPGRYYNFHFTDEETSSKKLSHLPKVSCLEESRVSHILKPIPRDSPHPSRRTWVAKWIYLFSSVSFSRSVVSDSLWPHGLQHARLPCPSPTPRACSNSYPLSRWCHPTISSSVVPLSSRLQSSLASGCFPVSWFYSSGGQTTGVFTSASVLPMNIQDWFPFGLTSWISLQCFP